MAFNNGFPMAYQPFYGNQGINYQMQPQNAPQGQNGGIIWVQGEAGAKSYLVAPNTTVQLWDSESQSIYLKSADASGMPTMKILDYTIREQNGQNTPSLMPEDRADYVTRKEFNDFTAKVERYFSDNGKKVKEGKDNG
jgi:hypothetical protein